MDETLYQEIDEKEEAEMPIIWQSSDYYVEDKLIYQYNNDSGLLKLSMDKKDFNELLKNLGNFPEEGASFCFLLPQMGEVCFTGVQNIERIDTGRKVRGLSRIFRRRRR